jgi:hypothetical protein
MAEVTVKVTVELKDEWNDDGSYLYPVPQFSNTDFNVQLPSSMLTKVTDLLGELTEDDRESTWVISSIEVVDTSQETG